MRLQKEIPSDERFKAIYGTFNIIVRHNDYRVRIGRGSLSALAGLQFYPRLLTDDLILAEIGGFCEFADTQLILGGEHPSDRPIHVTFGASLEIMATNNKPEFIPTSKGRIVIDACCVFGVRTTVLSGSRIGNNCSIAAGAVVKGTHAPNSLLAGIPAKSIKQRLDTNVYRYLCKNPWWEASYDWLVNSIQQIQAQQPPTYVFQEDPYAHVSLVFDASLTQGRIKTLDLAGWESNGQYYRRQDMPSQIRDYIDQLKQDSPVIIDTDMPKYLLS